MPLIFTLNIRRGNADVAGDQRGELALQNVIALLLFEVLYRALQLLGDEILVLFLADKFAIRKDVGGERAMLQLVFQLSIAHAQSQPLRLQQLSAVGDHVIHQLRHHGRRDLASLGALKLLRAAGHVFNRDVVIPHARQNVRLAGDVAAALRDQVQQHGDGNENQKAAEQIFLDLAGRLQKTNHSVATP